LDNYGASAENKAEAEKMGLLKYMKKNRQYAQFSYQDYRIPQSRPEISISCTNTIVDKEIGLPTQETTFKGRTVEKAKRTMQENQSNRAIKKVDKTFHKKRFGQEAHAIYLEVHNLLNTENWTIAKRHETKLRLHELVTEFAYPGMVNGLKHKTVEWKFIESVEPPKVMRSLHTAMLQDANMYAQVTVRFHTKQNLVIYDRFGRVMYGSPESESNHRHVMEDVCFERHLADVNGKWRIHGKLTTSTYEREPAKRTIASIKKNALRQEADEWQEAELEKFPVKYSPGRENAMSYEAKMAKVNKNRNYLGALRKAKLMAIRGQHIVRMRGKVRTKSNHKLNALRHLRRDGKLPTPPKDFLD